MTATIEPDDFEDDLVLPGRATPPRRRPVPLLAAAVPIAGAVVLWLVTGSVMMLWFAVLGPLIAAASQLDAARVAKRERRRAAADERAAQIRITEEVARRHAGERTRSWSRTPDLAGMLTQPDDIWRASATDGVRLVVGRGDVASRVRVTGGEGTEGAAAIRRAAAILDDGPVSVPMTAGIAVVGPPAVAGAVVRALVLQACARVPPDVLTLVGDPPGDWGDRLPHRGSGGGMLLAIGDTPPDADAVILSVPTGAVVPPRCAVVIVLHDIGRATLRWEDTERDIEVEACGEHQARAIAGDLATRAAQLRNDEEERALLTLADLIRDPPDTAAGVLAAPIGTSGRHAVSVDLVVDGPHAVVAGVTGSGKSELLVTWITALCATRSPQQVTFLLADFKGGTAFTALAGLPHVVGVVSDLEGAGARRAIEGLRAEVRWRERALVDQGVRDVADSDLPRLVVVVDEFAALLAAHAELQAVFTDLAARGRALGIHLVLGTQRVVGTVRDALLANCPLRVSLRATDPADSRATIGTDDAARLPGGHAGRGVAYVRRAADHAPVRTRIALTSPADIAAIVARPAGAPPRRPWLPELPIRVALTDVPRPAGRQPGAVVLGIADEPDEQRQEPAVLRPDWRSLLVAGGVGAGKTSTLDTIAAQLPTDTVLRVPADAEGAWDATVRAADARAGQVVVIDDLDALITRFPLDYAQAFVQRWERILRDGGAAGIRVVASAQRLTGAAGRLGELFERRLLLRHATRAELVFAGGDAQRHDPEAAPGRGVIDGVTVQIAQVLAPDAAPRSDPTPTWRPSAAITGAVMRPGFTARRFADAAHRAGVDVVDVADATDPALRRASVARPLVIIGDAEAWQRSWRTLSSVRSMGELVVEAGCAQDLRLLAGVRDLPPYCRGGADRGWAVRDGELVRVRFEISSAPATRRSRRLASDRRADRPDRATVSRDGQGEG